MLFAGLYAAVSANKNAVKSPVVIWPDAIKLAPIIMAIHRPIEIINSISGERSAFAWVLLYEFTTDVFTTFANSVRSRDSPAKDWIVLIPCSVWFRRWVTLLAILNDWRDSFRRLRIIIDIGIIIVGARNSSTTHICGAYQNISANVIANVATFCISFSTVVVTRLSTAPLCTVK